MQEDSGLSKAERKKARRKQRAAAERVGAQELEQLADAAVTEAMARVSEVPEATEIALATVMPTIDAARYCRKRINEALGSAEWLDEVEVWVWDAHSSRRASLTDEGEANGVELRLEIRRDWS